MEEFDAERKAKITSDVIKMIHPIYPQFDSDMIAAGIKQVLENDKDHTNEKETSYKQEEANIKRYYCLS